MIELAFLDHKTYRVRDTRPFLVHTFLSFFCLFFSFDPRAARASFRDA